MEHLKYIYTGGILAISLSLSEFNAVLTSLVLLATLIYWITKNIILMKGKEKK